MRFFNFYHLKKNNMFNFQLINILIRKTNFNNYIILQISKHDFLFKIKNKIEIKLFRSVCKKA